MNVKFFLVIIITTLVVSGCSTYKEYDENSFSNFTWEPGKAIEFKPTIEDISESYRLGFGIRHVYGLPNSSMKITVKSISPSGNATMESYDFILKDEKGDYVSSCAGDMCDLEAFVSNEINFLETGEYTFMLSHNGKYSISGVAAIGLIIDQN